MGDVVHLDFQWCALHLGRHIESGGAKVLQFPFRMLAILRCQTHVRRDTFVRRELPMTISATLIPPNTWP